jgi:predicted amidohydrolase YtcJ
MKTRDLSPDLVVCNGKLYTLDADDTVAQAAAIKDGRFLSIGGDAEIKALAGPHTRQIDLGGRAAIPGIFDSHVHMLEAGAKLATIRLDECTSPEEMMELVRERAKVTPPGAWIIGQGWNENNLPIGACPPAATLTRPPPSTP